MLYTSFHYQYQCFRFFFKGFRKRLQEIVAKTPDATLEEIRAQLPVEVSIQTVHVELKKLKLIYKKVGLLTDGTPLPGGLEKQRKTIDNLRLSIIFYAQSHEH